MRSEESMWIQDTPSPSEAKGLTTHRFDYDLTKTFDVLVGKKPNQQRFTVYHDVFARRSKFFRAARSGRWATEPDQATTLDDHDPEVFSVYLHCVNFGRKALEEHIDAIPDDHDLDSDSLEQIEKREKSTKDNDESGVIEETQGIELEGDGREDSNEINHYVWKFGDSEFRDKFLVDLYILADKLMDHVTANMAIDKLIRMAEARDQYSSSDLVSYVYGSTTAGCPLRKLFGDWYVFSVSESWVDTVRQYGYPPAFLEDLIHEIYNLLRDNQGKRVRKVFTVEKLADRRPKDYYHQKVDETSGKTAMPANHQED